MLNDCVTESLFAMLKYRDTDMANYSRRFHFAICKLLDGGLEGGTTVLTGHRAIKGWFPCVEKLFPSDRALPAKEYGNWTKIPKEAWLDSRRETIERGFDQINYFLISKQAHYINEITCSGKDFLVIIQSLYGMKSVAAIKTTLFIDVYSKDGMIIGWVVMDFRVNDHAILISDFYIKDAFRNIGVGRTLINVIHGLTKLAACHKKWEIDCWIPAIDINTADKKIRVLNFFRRNNFNIILDKSSIARDREYSKILAFKHF